MFSAASAAGQRNPDFSVLTDADFQHFKQILGSNAVVTGPDALQKYNRQVLPAVSAQVLYCGEQHV
jgi:hypothetical protein